MQVEVNADANYTAQWTFVSWTRQATSALAAHLKYEVYRPVLHSDIEGSRILQRYMRDTANQRYLTDRNRAICAEQNTTLIDP